MSSLLWPGDARAGELFDDAAVLAALTQVEDAWLTELIKAGIAPPSAAANLAAVVAADDAATVADGAEGGGNPVIPLLRLLRERIAPRNGDAATWLHRGLTSQDVLDSALMLCARAAVERVRAELRGQVEALAGLADQHRGTPMVARTLTQHAVPTTFGGKTAGWLAGVLDAADDLAALAFPAQIGAAAGTLAAPVELARHASLPDPVGVARALAERTAERLGLAPALPWHTNRAPVTRLGDALVRCLDAQGRIANDVLTLSRPEIGELRELVGAGRGGSSAMPQKANPVLSVLIRRAALTAPALGAQLHLAAAEVVDERPDGAWHVEWPALQLLCRHAVTAVAQGRELLDGLQVDAEKMAATLAAADGVLDEAASIAGLFDQPGPPQATDYLGASDAFVDAAIERAGSYLKGQL
ncbi:lyase family protein [uncultured Jatrophihabitans sp.]|uniref:lyase family protein n=1 Tax=uncultured Jatrophihabitans sp. TaxID=1610747 RepID=UPI0035CAC0C5